MGRDKYWYLNKEAKKKLLEKKAAEKAKLKAEKQAVSVDIVIDGTALAYSRQKRKKVVETVKPSKQKRQAKPSVEKPFTADPIFDEIFPELPKKFRRDLWTIVKSKDNLVSFSRFYRTEKRRWLMSEEECRVLYRAGMLPSPHMIPPPKYDLEPNR